MSLLKTIAAYDRQQAERRCRVHRVRRCGEVGVAVAKQFRWLCPNNLHPAVLGPSRPRKDDVRRYCLPCSEKSGRLVERVVPAFEAKRVAAKQRAAKKAAKRRAAKPKWVSTVFGCGVTARGAMLYGDTPIYWDVRPSKKPRAPLVDGRVSGVIVYDHEGCGKYDARAIVILAELLWLDTAGLRVSPAAKSGNMPTREFIRTRLKKIDITPPITGPLWRTWEQISYALRARDAEQLLGQSSERFGTVSGRMSSSTPVQQRIPRVPDVPGRAITVQTVPRKAIP